MNKPPAQKYAVRVVGKPMKSICTFRTVHDYPATIALIKLSKDRALLAQIDSMNVMYNLDEPDVVPNINVTYKSGMAQELEVIKVKQITRV